MAEFRESTTSPIVDMDGHVVGMVDHFSVVVDQSRVKTRRWLEIGGVFEDPGHGRVPFTSRIPIADGLMIVRAPVEES